MRTNCDLLDVNAEILPNTKKFLSEGLTNHSVSKLPQITVLLYPSFQMQVIFPVEVIHLHSRFADSILVRLDITVLVYCDETVYQFQFMRDSPFNNKTV